MSARDDILKKINKKSDKIAELRDRSRGFIRPEKLVSDFINEVEQARIEAKGGFDFSSRVTRAHQTLEHRVRRLDAHATIIVVWDREEQAEVWEDLRPSGVRILWSDVWQRNNPDKDSELFIGVEQLFLEGI